MTKATHFTRGNDQNRHDRVVAPTSQEAIIKTSGTVQYNDQSHPLHEQQRPKQAWPCGIMTTGIYFTSSNDQNSRDQTEVTIAPTWKSVLHKLLSHFQGNNLSSPFNQPVEHDTALRPFFLLNNNIYGTPSRKNPDRLQKHKNALISSHTLTRTRARKCKLVTFSPPWTITLLFVLSLDISAAFDTIDHQFLYSLHISDRYQSTSVNNSSLSSPQFMYGLP